MLSIDLPELTISVVGDDYIRGVSGGERKRVRYVVVLEIVPERVLVLCTDIRA